MISGFARAMNRTTLLRLEDVVVAHNLDLKVDPHDAPFGQRLGVGCFIANLRKRISVSLDLSQRLGVCRLCDNLRVTYPSFAG